MHLQSMQAQRGACRGRTTAGFSALELSEDELLVVAADVLKQVRATPWPKHGPSMVQGPNRRVKQWPQRPKQQACLH